MSKSERLGLSFVSSPPPERDDNWKVALWQNCRGAVVQIQSLKAIPELAPFGAAVSGVGSGFVLQAVQGSYWLVTNMHVIDRSDLIRVIFKGIEPLEARIVGMDPVHDLALLQLVDVEEQVPWLKIAEERPPVGAEVATLGYPMGLEGILADGILSGQSDVVANPHGYQVEGLLITNADINPGNSGGPLLDRGGRVIGVNSFKIIGSGIGFSVPIRYAMQLAQNLPQDSGEWEASPGMIVVDTTLGPAVWKVIDGSDAARHKIEGLVTAVDMSKVANAASELGPWFGHQLAQRLFSGAQTSLPRVTSASPPFFHSDEEVSKVLVVNKLEEVYKVIAVNGVQVTSVGQIRDRVLATEGDSINFTFQVGLFESDETWEAELVAPERES